MNLFSLPNSLSPSLSSFPSLPISLPLSRTPSLPLPTLPALPLSLSLPLSLPPSLSPALLALPPLSLSQPPSLSLLPSLSFSPASLSLFLSLSVDLFFYDVAATWISLGLLGCQLDQEESTITAVLDLDKKLRVRARFG